MEKLILDNLKDELNNNKLVAFVGAGASCNYGLPDWYSLTKTFASELNMTVKDEHGKTSPKTSFSSDDYIIIPLHYKNKFGTRKYKQLVRNELTKIDTTIKKIEVYNPLFEIKPQHIITTNFDDLLEKENDKLIDRYDVIKCDKDLAKAKNNNYIVKMHGDLKKGNFVLNEEDYLNYSNKFKLIDNFVKSLCATHTLLFIGFSFADPNFKKIFHWVQNILGKDSRKAYFFQINLDEIEDYQLKYFSTKHIQIVTHKDLLGKASKSLNYGERTYQMISLLKNDFIDELYERLYVFKDFNILFQSDIIEILADFPFNINPNYFNNFIINDDSIINKISKSEYDKKKFELVTKTLSKAGYDGFYSMEDKNNKIIVKFDDQVKKDELFDLYTDFKYTEVLKKIKELNPKSISVLRKKAFYLLKLEKNKKALTTYNMISKKLSNSADFSQFILNEMSRKIVNQILQFYCFNEKKYWEEARNINVEKYINNLPLRERSNALRFYKIINNIFHKYYSRLLKIRNELEGDKILLERGGWTNNDHHSSIQRIADELILYVFKNHLPFDFYSEIKSVFYYYFDSVMLSYTTKVNKATENQLNQKASKIYSLDYNPIFIAIYYIKTSDLVDLLKKYKPDFPIILENIKPIELINKFSNLIEFLYTNRFEKTNWDKSVLIENLLKRCNNFIILLSNCDLTSEDYRRFFNNIIKLNKKISLLHIRNYLIPFMETIVKVNHNKMLDFDLLINSILLKFNFIHFKRCKKDMRKFFELVHEIAPVYHSRKYKSLSKLLEHIDSNQDDKEMAVILYNLIDGYNIFGKGLRIQFRKVLSNINQILLEEDYNLYVVILFEKIVDYQVYNKSTLLSLLPNWFEYCKKSIISQSQKGDQSNDIEFILDFLYKLKMNLNHKHHNLFKENFSYIERSVPFYDYFLFDRKIKKELFKGIWLLHLLKDPNPINRFKIIMKDLGLNSALMKIKVYESLTGQINDKQHKALIQVLQLLDKLDYN